jgi:predicted ArsR family transcriptional regulator
MTEVWEHSDAEGTARLVLLALADHADDETRASWPSVAHIARKTRVSPATARRQLHALQELGEIRIQQNAGGTQKTPEGRRPNLDISSSNSWRRFLVSSRPASHCLYAFGSASATSETVASQAAT